MSNIFSLPPELLSLILLETQAEARAYNTSTHKKRFPFPPNAIHWLRLTNHAFNAIILCTPELWSFLAITEDAPTHQKSPIRFHQWERHISRYIERSGTCPLDVTFAYTHDEILQLAYTLLSPHMDRLRTLRFLTGFTTSTHLRPSYKFLQPFLVGNALPRLQALTVQTWHMRSDDHCDPLVINNAANIKHLTITGSQMHEVRFSSPNIPKLRSLEFSQCDMDRASFATFIDPSKETLEYLNIDFYLGGCSPVRGPVRRIPLLALRTLRINMMFGWNLLTEYIHAPNLRSLTLLWPPRHAPHNNSASKDPKPLDPMLHLHSLEWLAEAADTSDGRESFAAILAACPNVQQMSIVEKHIRIPRNRGLQGFGRLTEELKVLATEEEGGVKFCAGLKVLRVSCSSSELLDEVKRLRAGALELVETGYRATY
ncbi:hypothetical protein FRB99_000121 [Tulasnella sp. 403]|nr:hypothetical protein FRB99_000121 [Tulasnella sp. 403]